VSRLPGRRPDLVRWIYRRLLGLYPGDFRRRFEDDLLQAFDDRRGEPRFSGRLGGVRLVLFLLRDFVTSVPLAHRPRRDDRLTTMMNRILQDLRFSGRMLAKNPVFTIAAVLTLAMGIGLNAATFSAVRGLLLKPLSGTERPERLVQLYRMWPGLDFGSNSIPHYQDLRDRTGEVFSDVGAWSFATMAISVDGRSERLMGSLVSANFFQTYGVTPALGRAFIPGEEATGPGAHPVVVLGNTFWRSRFGADPSIVGRTLTLNGQPFEVVGVAPPEFRGPANFVDFPIYVPLMMQLQISPGFNQIEARSSNSFNVTARLRDGVTEERAGQVLDAVLLQLREEFPDAYADQVGTLVVNQMEAGIHPSFRRAQLGMSGVMLAVVALLLLIACVNVANLFLTRARERRREMGIRLSLGAGRGRIVQQLLTESLVFSAVAGAAGLGLASLAIRLLSQIRPPMDGPWAFAIEMDDTVLLFTVIVTVAAGILFGLAPALQSARSDTVSAVKGESPGKAGSSRMSSGLVVVQIALSLLLLVTSGLFIRSLQGATSLDPGFDEPRTLVVASLNPGLQGYDRERSRQLFDRLLEDVRALPETRAVGLSDWLPLGLSGSDRGVSVPGYDFVEGERQSLYFGTVTEGFLEALGVELLEGRTFTEQDDASAPPSIIVNERFAEHFWPGQSALGKVVHTAGKDREVIGVVANGKYRSLGEGPTDMMFLPLRELFRTEVTIVARTGGAPATVLRRIQEIVREADPDMPVYDVRTMEDHMGVALLPARLGGSVLGLFGLLGLALAAVGIYGVMAYSVAQRTRELGIRVALGADRARVVRLVFGEGMRLTAIGAVLGLVGAVLAGRLVQGLLYNVSALDPAAFLGVPSVLVAVAALAVYVPARRAAGVEPVRALKSE
jgi:predicted permease